MNQNGCFQRIRTTFFSAILALIVLLLAFSVALLALAILTRFSSTLTKGSRENTKSSISVPARALSHRPGTERFVTLPELPCMQML